MLRKIKSLKVKRKRGMMMINYIAFARPSTTRIGL
jgi:hypothetical protein